MGRDADGEIYLVTGFPTFRARKMVEQLLRAEPDAPVYVVVHEKLAEDAATAISGLELEQQSRLIVLDGDAAAMDLGLSRGEYQELSARVTRIHHVAQVTYPGVSREMAEAVNIGAMREIIEVARQCSRLRSVVVHSSAMVSGNRTGLVLEDELACGQTFRTPVEETLARAERIARANMAELPILVVRATQIVGDSLTGEVDRFDGPYLLILLIVSSPQDFPVLLPTRGDAPMHLVPIDYVVKAAHHIGRRADAAGRTFHLADPRPLSARRVFELVARAGGKRLPQGFIPTNLARAMLRTPGVGLVAKSPKAFIELMATRVRYDTRRTEDALRGSGITCPPFESYVNELTAFVKRRVEERRSARDDARDAEVDDPLG